MLPRDANRSRNGDTLSPEKLSDLLGLPILSSKLYWEGGNVLYDGHTCLIGAQTIAYNVTRLGLSEEQVKKAFKLEFGAKVLVMGDIKSALKSARALKKTVMLIPRRLVKQISTLILIFACWARLLPAAGGPSLQSQTLYWAQNIVLRFCGARNCSSIISFPLKT